MNDATAFERFEVTIWMLLVAGLLLMLALSTGKFLMWLVA